MGETVKHRWYHYPIAVVANWMASRRQSASPMEELVTAPNPAHLYRERFTLDCRSSAGARYDPVEDDPSIQDALKEADLLAEAELEGWNGFGSCNIFWRAKQRILRDQFGIVWFTPSEMNPEVDYD